MSTRPGHPENAAGFARRGARTWAAHRWDGRGHESPSGTKRGGRYGEWHNGGALMHPSDERATRAARQTTELRERLAAERARAERAEADALTWRQQAELAWHRLDLTASEDIRAALWPEVVGAERRVIDAASEWVRAEKAYAAIPSHGMTHAAILAGFDEAREPASRANATRVALVDAVDALAAAEVARMGEATE